ncbi:DEAD/DEAH box helicase [Bdellovibrio sp. 22V]|uniref:DEAD/DEAH box helicase n=1 Tax=Bdellovibrio sp. 22V TaxID=3044166 RepID=UPI0025429617|nr:DEAD/DEAH box helicase [Bdellovibrio sp. 22V]WII71732.1 DEAD/DEAH box helicase [Bdellovibrio sp. 22V]
MALRNYQQAAVDSFFSHYAKGYKGHPLIVMPTGTGKSHVIAFICMSLLKQWPGIRILILTHVKELIGQNAAKLQEAWPEAPMGIYSAGLGRKETCYPVTYAGVQSVVKALDKFGKFDIILVDEAHMINPQGESSYKKIFNYFEQLNPRIAIGGLTATPWRMGYGAIYGQEDSLFERIALDLSNYECFNWFIEQGFLVDVVPRAVNFELDTSGVHLSGGEYNLGQLQAAVNVDKVTVAALQQCVAECSHLDAWLIFCTGIEHAERVAELCTEMGIPCKAVHSELSAGERDRILDDFKSGRLQAVANNGVLTTGFDYPGLKLIVGLRPSKSSALWTQIVGRLTRPHYAPGFDLSTQEGRIEAIRQSDKPKGYVYDFARNIRTLGSINDPVYPKRKGDKTGRAPVKKCCALINGKECGTENHAKALYCIDCGAEFSFEVKLSYTAADDAIVSKKNDMPVIEEFEVDRISCLKSGGRHGKPFHMRVVYYCGNRMFNEVVCFEHMVGSYPLRLAHTWWMSRSKDAIPATVDDALLLMNSSGVRTPTHIRVHTNLKYPEVKAFDFEGTNFGRLPKPDFARPIETSIELPDGSYGKVGGAANHTIPHSDDDIPF